LGEVLDGCPSGGWCDPAGKVFLASIFNKGVTVDLNVVPGLGDVNPIKHVEITLGFDGNEEAFD